MKKKVTLSIDDKVYDRFQKFCEQQGFLLSRQIEIDMENRMKEKRGEK